MDFRYSPHIQEAVYIYPLSVAVSSRVKVLDLSVVSGRGDPGGCKRMWIVDSGGVRSYNDGVGKLQRMRGHEKNKGGLFLSLLYYQFSECR